MPPGPDESELKLGELLDLLRADQLAGPSQGVLGNELRYLCTTGFDQETVGENPYWEIARLLPITDECSSLWARDHAVEIDWFVTRPQARRTALVKKYSWSIPTPDDITWIARHLDGRGVVEVGAGTGYWAWQLSQVGVDVIAFDATPFGENRYCQPIQYHPVHLAGIEVAAEHPHRALLLCWPPYDNPMAAKAVAAYAGDLLISIGEPPGGCTADDVFFDTLDLEWTEIGVAPRHVTWWGIHDYVRIYRRSTGPAR